jgi:protein-tyrosine-phosphatase
MNREKLKLIVRNLESLVECLKEEINSDTDTDIKDPYYEEIKTYLTDYDEVFYDGDEEDYAR